MKVWVERDVGRGKGRGSFMGKVREREERKVCKRNEEMRGGSKKLMGIIFIFCSQLNFVILILLLLPGDNP